MGVSQYLHPGRGPSRAGWLGSAPGRRVDGLHSARGAVRWWCVALFAPTAA